MAKKRLVDQVRDGERKVVISRYFQQREVDQAICTLEEAQEYVRIKLVKGWRYGLSSSQFFDECGDYEFDPYGEEVAELRRAVFNG